MIETRKTIEILLLMCVITCLFTASLTAAQSENCSEAEKLTIQAYDLGHQPDVFPEQKRLLNQALQFCHQYPEAHNNLASIFEVEKNYDQAIFHYRKAVEAKPDFAAAWFGLGEVYFKTGRFTQSLEAMLKACKAEPEAKMKIKELLETRRYSVSEAGEILNKENLLLLFDKTRRADINRMLADCGFKADVQPVVVFRNILFDTGSAELRSESEAQLKEICSALTEIGTVSVMISGHSDRQTFRGKSKTESDAMNMQLSKDRADSVARYLSEKGISSTRVKTAGYGFTRPEVEGDTPEAYQKNRRVTFEVTE